MRKIVSIILGWWFWITNRNEELVRKRLLICTHCELRKGLVCGVCFCPLQTKARLEDEYCPHPDGDKWKKSPSSQAEAF